MKFSTTSILAILAGATAITAAYVPTSARDVDLEASKDFEVMKREAYASAYAEAYDDILNARDLIDREAFPESESLPEFLEARGNDATILDYLRNIDTRTATGSFNKNVWTRIHGDTKSSVGGNLHIETGEFNNKPQARLIQSGVKGSAGVLVTVEPARASVGCAVHTLRVHYGGPQPPSNDC